MLTKTDLNRIGNVVDEKLEKKFDEKLKPIKENLTSLKKDVKSIKTDLRKVKKTVDVMVLLKQYNSYKRHCYA